MIAAVVAHINTAPAAISLTCPAIGCCSGDTKSTNLSIAVLNNSAVITMPIHRAIMIHSICVISRISPAIITIAEVMRWKLKFCSFPTQLLIPFQA